MSKRNKSGKQAKTTGKAKFIKASKIFVLSLEIFVSLILVLGIALFFIPNVKAKLLKTPFGKYLVQSVIDEDEYNENVYDNTYNPDNVEINDGLDEEKIKGYTTLALFGIDARGEEFDNVTHSDSIIVVAINNDTGEVKMVSMYRDTYVRITGLKGMGNYGKLTNAYFLGGVECAINTLNINYDLNIKDYAIVNFSGLADVIDLLGGVDVNLTKAEMDYINGYLVETRKVTGKDSPDVTSYGDNIHLTGLQAVSYCRIRYTTFYDENGQAIRNDYGRTARQRLVLSKIVEKAKSVGADALFDIVDIIFKGQSEQKTLKTSLTYETIIEMIPTLLEFSLVQEEGKGGFPYTSGTATINGASSVCHRGLAYNVKKLHEFLYNDADYEPTETVKKISETMVYITGYEEQKLDEDK